MIQIWNIEQNLQSVLNQIEENDGELTLELEEQLSITRENMSDKLYQIDKMRKIASNDLLAIKKEIDRLVEMTTKRENFINNIDTIIQNTVERFGKMDEKSKAKRKPKVIEFELGLAKVSYSESVEIDEFDKDFVPNELIPFTKATFTLKNQTYAEIKNLQDIYDGETKFTFSKTDIKEAIEKGKELQCASIKINSKLSWK